VPAFAIRYAAENSGASGGCKANIDGVALCVLSVCGLKRWHPAGRPPPCGGPPAGGTSAFIAFRREKRDHGSFPRIYHFSAQAHEWRGVARDDSHEVHSRTGLTRSSGIRGGCQSVVNRIESCHALSFSMERRAVVLRRDGRAGCFREVPFGSRAVSQLNNSRAWRADSFLTFLTARPTALLLDALARKLIWSKQVSPGATQLFRKPPLGAGEG
jgi:hypothetical protein